MLVSGSFITVEEILAIRIMHSFLEKISITSDSCE